MLKGLKETNPKQMNKGDPKPASSYPSVDSDKESSGGSMRTKTAPTPKTLGPRNA